MVFVSLFNDFCFPEMSLDTEINEVGSLLVLCWQTFFDSENRKLDFLRGSSHIH